MALFRFGVATEANNYNIEIEDQIWIKTEDGHFILMEDDENEGNKE